MAARSKQPISGRFHYKDQGLALSRGIVKLQLKRAGLKSARRLRYSERLEAVHAVLADALSARTPGVSKRLIRKLAG